MNTVLAAMLGAIGGAIGSSIFSYFALGTAKLIGFQKVIKALSHDALFARCELLISRGEITTDDLENLDMLYDAYRDMGMNGAGEELYNRAKSLPLETQTVGRQ